MAGITEAIWQLRDSLKAKAARPSTSKAAATVSRVEPDGTVWVRLAGGDGETPITKPTTAEVSAGDSVTVEIGRGSSRLVGNASTPAVGAAQVTTIVNPVAEIAAQAVTDAATAATAATEATESAAVAKAAADSANANLKSVVSGAQTVEKAVSVMQTALEAVVDYDPQTDTTTEWFWHDGNGAHVLGETSGYRNDIDSSGMHIVDVSDESEVAQFAADGASIAVGGAEVFSIEPNADSGSKTLSMNFGEGETLASEYQTVARLSPLPTVGTTVAVRLQIFYTTASASNTVYTDEMTLAYNGTSYTTATYTSSGKFTVKVRLVTDGRLRANGTIVSGSGITSLAVSIRHNSTASWRSTVNAPQMTFGTGSDARGENSAAIGESTLASGDAQTAIGRWNVEDTSGDYALVIGNGTSATRGNALTVDWDGNVTGGTVNGVDVGAIGTFYSASWSATSTSASNARLTNSLTLPAGVYVVTLNLPNTSTNVYAELYPISNHYGQAPALGSLTWVVQLASQTTVYARTAMSTSCSYTYTERGRLTAVRIA